MRKEWVQERGIAPLDFLVLTLHVLKKERTLFFKEEDHILTEDEHHLLTGLLERRFLDEPVAYLTGEKEFFGRLFTVSKDTLIPRPESECLIEDLLSFRQKTLDPECIFDIGTGSGALIITLACELKEKGVCFFGSDISADALLIAEENKNAHSATVTFFQGSLLEPYKKVIQSEPSFVYIIANLPYLSYDLFNSAPRDVQNYEPRTALVSENDGLAHYQSLFREMKDSPKLRGVCWVEISPEQTKNALKYIQTAFPETDVSVGQDLSGKDRFIRFTF